MDKIKKIIQIGSFEDEKWNSEGELYVFFEDESIDPVVIDANIENRVNLFESLAEQNGINVGTDGEELVGVIESAYESDVLTLCNKLDQAELDAANAALEAAREKAASLREEKGHSEGGINPGGEDNHERGEDTPEPGDDEPTLDPEEDVEELDEEVANKKRTGLKIAAGALAGVAALGGLHHLFSALKDKTENNKDIDNDQNKNVDFNTATFEELMNSMDENDQRRIVAEKAMQLVDNFHLVTHKDGNFRVVEDGNTYLDLSFEEALILTTFTSNATSEELYEILGAYGITNEQAKDMFESARTKLITYYMNGLEPSGLAELFENEKDQQFFMEMESAVLKFNAQHTTDASDQVIRNVYYNYILDNSINAGELSPTVRLLAFDTVYGSLNLTESASLGHTEFLEFHGMGAEDETRLYVENALGLDYFSLSEEEKTKYQNNIIPTGTDLVSLLENGQVMTEENATQEEMDASVSLTELVDKMGICNSVNAEIDERMSALDKMVASQSVAVRNANSHIVEGLREAGLNDLANSIEKDINNRMSDDLLKQVRASGATGADLVEDYETRMDALNGKSRPTIEQIVAAADRENAKKSNFGGSIKDVSTLINNRRHTYEHNLTSEDKDKGIIGRDENGIPIFDESVFDDMSDEEKEQFIKENGTVIEEETKEVVTEEEVKEEDLTEEEVKEVNQQKIDEYIAEQKNNGAEAAEDYKFRSNYTFANGTVTNPCNGEVYNLNEMEFGSAVIRAQAFANASLDSDNELVRNGNFYIDADQDEQILNAARVSAENYVNGLSQETKDEIVKASGLSWEEIKEQLIDGYESGYVTQMQSEIDALIAEGNNVFELTAAMQHDINEKNKKNEIVPEEEVEAVTEGQATSASSEEEKTEDQTVVIPEITVDQNETNPDIVPETPSTETEDDWLVNGSVAEDEIVVVPASEVNSNEQTLEEMVAAAYQQMLTQESEVVEPVKSR